MNKYHHTILVAEPKKDMDDDDDSKDEHDRALDRRCSIFRLDGWNNKKQVDGWRIQRVCVCVALDILFITLFSSCPVANLSTNMDWVWIDINIGHPSPMCISIEIILECEK